MFRKPTLLASCLVTALAGCSAETGPVPGRQSNRLVSNGVATTVYGQTSFTGSTPGAGQTGLKDPYRAVPDSSGGLWVADLSNNRLLHYPSGVTTADKVLGQPDYATTTATTTATGLSAPRGVALESSGGMYVADAGNHRVVHYPPASTTADRVYGQADFVTAAGLPPAAGTLYHPYDVAIDPNGGIYIADASNHRVLHYPGTSTTPDRVYGQGGSYTTSVTGCAADKLFYPVSVAADGSNVYISDLENNRVLAFSGTSTTATFVYGQPDLVTCTAGTSATKLNAPRFVDLDGANGLYVADSTNNRVVHFAVGNKTADRVIGQPDFTTSMYTAPPSASTLWSPKSARPDDLGHLYVVDQPNHRILRFDTGTCSGVSLALSPSNYSAPGTSVSMTASGTCDDGASAEYRYYLSSPSSGWSLLRDWGAASFTWDTTGKALGTYKVEVDVRTVGSTASYQSYTTRTHRLVGGGNCTAVSLASTPSSSASVGQTVSFSATPTCDAGVLPLYRYFRWTASSGWSAATDWQESPSYEWNTTGGTPDAYKWEVDVRSAVVGSTQAYATKDFTLNALGTCGSVGISASPSSPSPAGTTVEITGAASCTASSTPEYRFYIYSAAAGWSLLRDWGGASYSWNTTGLSGSYTLEVDARAQGSTASSESYAQTTYTLGTGGSGSCGSPAVSADPSASATVGTTVNLNGSSSCTGGGTAEYRYYLFTPGEGWALLRDWGASAYAWNTTGKPTGTYRIEVNVRAAGTGEAFTYSIVNYTLN